MYNAESCFVRDSLYFVAEQVRESYAKRDDPVERARWMAFSQVYTRFSNNLVAFGLEGDALGLTGEMFDDLPTWP